MSVASQALSLNVKRASALLPLLKQKDSCRCMSLFVFVEMAGIEPASESGTAL